MKPASGHLEISTRQVLGEKKLDNAGNERERVDAAAYSMISVRTRSEVNEVWGGGDDSVKAGGPNSDASSEIVVTLQEKPYVPAALHADYIVSESLAFIINSLSSFITLGTVKLSVTM